ncbi:restriction endonuclease subunit S [Alishewanella sp. HL-SH05]|uniref:restriction endonuclease subunit S n=1 Tax=Alishewanella sp. HL-SH05 TaxID=3461145 RepID=UPI0040417A66
MSSEWIATTLGEVCAAQNGAIQTGPFGSQLHASDYVETGIPVVMPSNIGPDGGISEDGIARIKQQDADRLSQHKLQIGDVVFSRRGDVTRNALIEPHQVGWLCGTGCLKVRLGDETKADAKFISYCLRSPETKEWLIRHAVGATMPNLNTSILSAVPIQIPPISEQKKITELLRALDDRIDLLRETNATLEAIAQALFKSWFVDFDPVLYNSSANAGTQAPSLPAEMQALFPSRLVESPHRLIPEGWKVGVLGDVAETSRKQVKPEQLSEETLYVGLEHIPRKQLGLDAWGTAEELASAKSAFERNNILFGKLRPYFHKVVIAPFEGVCSTDILVCKAKHDSYHQYVAMQLFSDELIAYADRLSNGAKMPRINWKDLAAYEVVIPPNEIAENFSIIVEPMIGRILANVEKAQILASLRDTLLPRLISGQLRLPEAETALAEQSV